MQFPLQLSEAETSYGLMFRLRPREGEELADEHSESEAPAVPALCSPSSPSTCFPRVCVAPGTAARLQDPRACVHRSPRAHSRVL